MSKHLKTPAPHADIAGPWTPVWWEREPHDPTHVRIWQRIERIGMSQRHEWRYADGDERAEEWIYVPFRNHPNHIAT